MTDLIRLPKRALVLFDSMVRRRLSLVRQTSDTDSAVKNGGYVYSLHPGGQAVHHKPARILIGAGILVSQKDDLFSEIDGGGAGFRPYPSVAGDKTTSAEEA
jgi:hypothetical protein